MGAFPTYGSAVPMTTQPAVVPMGGSIQMPVVQQAAPQVFAAPQPLIAPMGGSINMPVQPAMSMSLVQPTTFVAPQSFAPLGGSMNFPVPGGSGANLATAT